MTLTTIGSVDLPTNANSHSYVSSDTRPRLLHLDDASAASEFDQPATSVAPCHPSLDALSRRLLDVSVFLIHKDFDATVRWMSSPTPFDPDPELSLTEGDANSTFVVSDEETFLIT